MPTPSHPSRPHWLHRAARLCLVLALLSLTGVPGVSAYGRASLSISASSLVEGDDGTADMLFTVTRTGDTTSAVAVGYTTHDGTALAGTDYTAQTGQVTLASGVESAEIRVPVIGNTRVQGSRSFSVELTGVTNAYGPPVSFASLQSFAVASNPNSTAVGDFNSDGRPDLAVANTYSGSISVLLNTTAPGAVTSSFAAQQTFAVESFPYSVVVGDFNSDGRPDLAAANTGINNVSVLLNTTLPGAESLSFAPQNCFDAGSEPRFVAAGDFNSDGRPDLVIVNSGSNDVTVMLNDTAPGAAVPVFLSQQTFAVGMNPFSAAVGDFNQDGRPDLAVVNSGSGSMSVLLNAAAPGADAPAFTGQQTFPVGDSPLSIAAGDLNGDGRADLAVASAGSNALSILLNNTVPGSAAPAFTAQQTIEAGFIYLSSVVAGDFNGDGRPDLAAADYGSGSVSVLVNGTEPGAESPSFAQQQIFALDGSPQSLAAGDFNSDGKPDLAASNYGPDSVSVLLNTTTQGPTGPGFAVRQSFSTGVYPSSAAAADFNGDGKPDIVSANMNSGNLSVLLNTAAPGASSPVFAAQQTFTAGVFPIAVVVGDFNSDGRPDLAAADYDSTNLMVLLNTTSPGAPVPVFAPRQTFTAGFNPSSIAVGDFNLDGRPDLASANQGTNNLSVLLNTTAPGAAAVSFAAQQTYPVGTRPTSIAAGDFNNDGRLDLAATNYGSRSLSVLLNTTAPGSAVSAFASSISIDFGTPCFVAVGDFNRDGRPDLVVADSGYNRLDVLLNTTSPGAAVPTFTPPQFFFVQTYPSSAAVADFNGDGMPDLAAGNEMTGSISVLMNTAAPGAGLAAFSPAQNYAVSSSLDCLTVGDFNLDGRPDLAAGDYSTLMVLLNQPALITAGPAVGTIIDDDAAASLAIVSGDHQSAVIHTPFAARLTVEARNVAGHPVEGAGVAFVTPESGPGGTFAAADPLLTDASGRVSASIFTANGTPGSYQVTAFADGYGPSVQFSLTNDKMTAAVSLISLAQTYDGTPKQAGATTDPPGLPVEFTYNGSGDLPISAGTYTVEAAVVDDLYQGTASGELVIAKAATATLLQSSSEMVSEGSPVTLTALVSPVGELTGTIPGTVTFYDGGEVVGTAELTAGGAGFEAVLTVSNLPPGRRVLTASYGESANFLSSTSAEVNLVVLAKRLYFPLIGK